MKPAYTRRRHRRPASREIVSFKKDNQHEQQFFGETTHEPFFKPMAVMPHAATVQRKCDECAGEEKVRRATEEKKEEKVMKMEDKKEEEKVQRATEEKKEEKVMKKEDEKEEEKVMKKEDKKEEEKVMKMGDKKEEEKVQKKETDASSAPGNKGTN